MSHPELGKVTGWPVGRGRELEPADQASSSWAPILPSLHGWLFTAHLDLIFQI